ncbi:MAG: DUF4177 domain-containing protein [Desulfoprunum sp.]|nr:DUF4177 domain-containing protein [Desulfoprunum sp.]
MRWSYKTILYELKKEGLLGSAFLDESEIELSLNEFGATGWELISMLETRDGIIAVFKQPLGRLSAQPVYQEQEENSRVISAPQQPQVVREVVREREPVLRESEPIIRATEQTKEKAEPVSGIGSIRIE